MKLISQVYLLTLLLAAIILAPLSYLPATLVLLVVLLLTIYRSRYHRLGLIVPLAVLFLLPLALAQFLGYLTEAGFLSVAFMNMGVFTVMPAHAIAVVAVLPVIYLLDLALVQSAQRPIPGEKDKEGRSVTTTTISLFSLALTMVLLSIIVASPVIFLAACVLLVYLLVVLVRVLHSLPATAFDIPDVEKRVVSGDVADISTYLASRATIRLRGMVVPVEPWVKARPVNFELNGLHKEISFSVVPPLAGPLHPHVRVSGIDTRGIVRVNCVAEPVSLHVIPRAKYAEWLALRYLEQTGEWGTGEGTVIEARSPRRGTEYLESRSYQPGDELRRIDWKHTVKLNQLTVKEFVEAGGQTAIIGVNLSVTDAEEADRLAFDLITTVLTLTREAVPAALVAYNREQVLLVTAVIEPREALKQALALVKSITIEEFGRRLLQAVSMGKLRRNIGLLKETTSQPARRLFNILDFEYKAVDRAARNHPAALALMRATENVPAPAAIVLVSRLNHDIEALTVTTEKLTRRGFVTLPLGEMP